MPAGTSQRGSLCFFAPHPGTDPENRFIFEMPETRGTRVKLAVFGASGYPFNSAQLPLIQPVRQGTARACTRAVIPVSAQRKTGISLTQARARKDEIPARRFAWPE